MTDRQCGSCAACCTVLGVAALRKHSGQACKHISGAVPEKRCTIYKDRPFACSNYICMWRAGGLADNQRPDKTGLVITPYATGFSVMVFDQPKAGDPVKQGTPLNDAIRKLADLLVEGEARGLLQANPQIRVVFMQSKRVMLFQNGNVFLGKLYRASPKEYEELKFECDNKPIGNYLLLQQPAERAGDKEITTTNPTNQEL